MFSGSRSASASERVHFIKLLAEDLQFCLKWSLSHVFFENFPRVICCFNYNITKESFFPETHLSGCCHAWTFSISMLPSFRNQSNHLQCKSIDKSIDCSLWGEPCHEKKLILFHFYFYLFTSFINAVRRNIFYRYFLFFHITFIIIYHIVFIQKLLKLGAIFASNSNTMFIFTRLQGF